MQGRLTPANGRGIQFFPFGNWENEFYGAQRLKLDEIEFIFDYENYINNPLWTEDGIKKIKQIEDKTNIQINAVCFDYFMRRPFYKVNVKEQDFVRNENTQIIKKVLSAMEQLKINLLEIPLVDTSSLQTELEKNIFFKWMMQVVESSDKNIYFALETDLNCDDFVEYLNRFSNRRVGANYDSGNSSGLGYDAYKEVTTLKNYILNVHIKDRILHGTTVKLGTGSADFDALFRGLHEIGYKHNFILQAARGIDSEEEKNILEQMSFVKEYMKKYDLLD